MYKTHSNTELDVFHGHTSHISLSASHADMLVVIITCVTLQWVHCTAVQTSRTWVRENDTVYKPGTDHFSWKQTMLFKDLSGQWHTGWANLHSSAHFTPTLNPCLHYIWVLDPVWAVPPSGCHEEATWSIWHQLSLFNSHGSLCTIHEFKVGWLYIWNLY